MQRALVVITCATRPQYLCPTLRSIESAGGRLWPGDARFLAYNGDGLPYAGVRELHWERLRLPGFGGSAVYRALVAWAVRAGVEQLTVFEDDLTFAPHALDRIYRLPVPEWAALAAWFDMGETGPATPAGWARVPSSGGVRDGWWGSQAFTWPARTLAWLDAQDWTATKYGGQRMAQDIVMGELLKGSPWPEYAVHCPNLVQHAGAVSAWDPSRPGGEFAAELLSRSFTGADARELWTP